MVCVDVRHKEKWESWMSASSSCRAEGVIQRVWRSVSEFHWMNVGVVRQRKRERKNWN
jgi:hypothetical protein